MAAFDFWKHVAEDSYVRALAQNGKEFCVETDANTSPRIGAGGSWLVFAWVMAVAGVQKGFEARRTVVFGLASGVVAFLLGWYLVWRAFRRTRIRCDGEVLVVEATLAPTRRRAIAVDSIESVESVRNEASWLMKGRHFDASGLPHRIVFVLRGGARVDLSLALRPHEAAKLAADLTHALDESRHARATGYRTG